MAKKTINKLVSFIAWLVGVIVALSIGFAMTTKTLGLPAWLGGTTVSVIAGWVIIIATILGVIMAIIKAIS